MSRLQPESAKYKAFTGCYMATVENKAVMRGSVDSGCCGVNVLKTQGRGGAGSVGRFCAAGAGESGALRRNDFDTPSLKGNC